MATRMWVSMRFGVVRLAVGEHDGAAGDHAADPEAGKLADPERQQAQLLLDRHGRRAPRTLISAVRIAASG